MARLFVAVDLPQDTRQALAAVQPAAVPGVRLVASDQMHVTLHYIGDGDIERIAKALATLSEPAFALSMEGVGQFCSADGSVTLWAAIQESNDLRRLHQNVATVLSIEGFRQEARPYTPHVTVARCEPKVGASVADEFLTRHARLHLPALPITAFSLYSSEFLDGVPVYRRERLFRLSQPD
jgi:2'-5' RNA ligase